MLRVQLLGGLHKLSVPINSTIQFALLPEEDDGPPEKLGKEWERKFTSVSDVLDMRILPPVSVWECLCVCVYIRYVYVHMHVLYLACVSVSICTGLQGA